MTTVSAELAAQIDRRIGWTATQDHPTRPAAVAQPGQIA
jgi:hypothetical protein